MYRLHMTIPEYQDPWLLPFDLRMRSFYEAHSANRKCIVAVYNHPDNSTFRYRIYNVYQALKKSSSLCLCYFFEDELHHVISRLGFASVVVMCRTSWTPLVQRTIDVAKERKIPVLFDVDDRVFDLECLQLLADSLDISLDDESSRKFWGAYIALIYMVANQADGFITTNDFLGQRLQNKFGKPFVVIENSLNEEQLIVSSEVRRQKLNAEQDNYFTLGYFSGSPSHVNDLKVALPEIIELLHQYEKMKLLIVGYMDLPNSLKELAAAQKVFLKSFVDFKTLQVLMAQVDLNLVPLFENGFTNCKSNLKFFEGAVVDVPTCATPIYSYAHSIQDKKTGFLCRQGQWYQTISDIYLGKYDLNALRNSAREYALKHYSGEYFLASIEKAYDSILHQLSCSSM